jgi:uncharacterized protein (TIGR03437 family)
MVARRTLGCLALGAFATLSWAHSVVPFQFNLTVGGAAGTVTVMNNNMEQDCTTRITWQLVGSDPTIVMVAPSPTQAPGVTVDATQVDYVTPPAASANLTVTPVKAGTAELLVTWNVIVPNPVNPVICSGSATQRIPITVTDATTPPTQPPPTTPGPLRCTANAGTPPNVRAEGLAEPVANIVINCTGGNPTVRGGPVPTVDFKLFLNTNIASRFYSDGTTEALLLIDDPTPANQAICNGTCTLNGIGGNINYAVPGAPANGGQPVRNVFRGRFADPNSIVWLGIPFDPPGTVATRVLRITNVRANASQLGFSPTLVPSQLVAFLNTSGQTSLPISNPQQTVGFVQRGLLFDVQSIQGTPVGGTSFQQCVAANPNLDSGATPSGGFRLRFIEGFASSFKPRNPSGSPTINSPQNVPGQVYNAETAFYNPSFGADQGLADHGTRLIARFNNVPAGVRLYATNANDPSSTPVTVRLTNNASGPFAPVAPLSQGLFEVPLVGGTGQAVWEVINSSSNQIDEVNVRVYTSYQANQPGLGTATVNMSFAPISTVSTLGATPPMPRFADASTVNTAFSINACQTNLLFPFVTNLAGFDTGLAISNTAGGIEIGNTSLDTGPAFGTIPLLNANTISTLTLNVNASNTPQTGREATSNWLTVNVDQTSTPTTATITANPTGLAPGTYVGGITIASPQASGPLNLPVRFTVSPPGPFFTAGSVVNAASYFPQAVAPGEAIVIFGRRFGPPNLATLLLDPNGVVTTTLGDTRIFFDDIPAPMIYASDANGGQVSAFVPFGVSGRTSTVMRLEYRGTPSIRVRLPVLDAIPGLFTLDSSGGGPGAILHPDFTAVTADNPTTEDGIVLMFGTGAGQTNPPGRDGRLATAPLPRQVLEVRAFIDGREAEVLYAGPAPDLVEGVLQVNARVPRGSAKGDVQTWITVGDKRSQPGVTVAVR